MSEAAGVGVCLQNGRDQWGAKNQTQSGGWESHDTRQEECLQIVRFRRLRVDRSFAEDDGRTTASDAKGSMQASVSTNEKGKCYTVSCRIVAQGMIV